MLAFIAFIVFLVGVIVVSASLIAKQIVRPHPYRRHRSKLDFILSAVFDIGLGASVFSLGTLFVVTVRDPKEDNVILLVITLVFIGIIAWTALTPVWRRRREDDEFLIDEYPD